MNMSRFPVTRKHRTPGHLEAITLHHLPWDGSSPLIQNPTREARVCFRQRQRPRYHLRMPDTARKRLALQATPRLPTSNTNIPVHRSSSRLVQAVEAACPEISFRLRTPSTQTPPTRTLDLVVRVFTMVHFLDLQILFIRGPNHNLDHGQSC